MTIRRSRRCRASRTTARLTVRRYEPRNEHTCLYDALSLRLSQHTEIASNFKSQGNDYFKGKRYREAAGFYTQALDAQPEDKTLREALLLNRAACNLELRAFYLSTSPNPLAE